MANSYDEWYMEVERRFLTLGRWHELREIPAATLERTFLQNVSADDFARGNSDQETSNVSGEVESVAATSNVLPIPMSSAQHLPDSAQFGSTQGSPPACLCCGSSDLFNVSAIYSQGTWRTNSQSVATSVTVSSDGHVFPGLAVGHGYGSGQTDLASRLAPPPRPYFRKAGFGCGFLTLTGSLFLAGLCACFYFITPDGKGEAMTLLVGTLLVGSSFLIHYLAKRELDIRNEEGLRNWETCYAIYEGQLAKWQNLLYCPRCDAVSDPKTGNWAGTSQMSLLIR